MNKKLRENRGIALIFVLLLTAIGLVSLSIAVVAYQQHLRNARRLFDEAQVATAVRVARESYILDIRSGGVTYYFDDDLRNVVDASTFEGKVDLRGYGRSYESENRKAETGAVGIPNKGEDGGPQFLAVSVEADGTTHCRWQGPYVTAYDYELMTDGERERLTQSQIDQIGAELVYGRSMPQTEGEADTSGQTETEADVSGQTETLRLPG